MKAVNKDSLPHIQIKELSLVQLMSGKRGTVMSYSKNMNEFPFAPEFKNEIEFISMEDIARIIKY